MSVAQPQGPLQLPATLETQLRGFRFRVWVTKMAEAIGVAAFAVLVASLCVFALDRFFDTPAWLRMGVLFAALCGCAVIPLYLHHWIWRRRRWEQLARLLTAKLPQFGDQLLGIIELVRSESEQARSRALCEAAIRQVAEDAGRRDFRKALPRSRYRLWGLLAAGALAAVIGLAMFFPAAAGNAWARLLAPWNGTPRYTFAALEPLPEKIVVPHGEPFTVAVRLADGALWHPQRGEVRLGRQQPVRAPLRDDGYRFQLPAQIEPGLLRVAIGDARYAVQVKPVLRPELMSVVAEVHLPDYLGRPEPARKDVRGGAVSLVRGSRAAFVATASRALSAATVDDRPEQPADATIRSPLMSVDGAREIRFAWEDEFGLAGREPFTLTVSGRDDEAPSLACEDLPRSKVVLDSEQLSFRVKADDDFGVRQIGVEWQGLDNAMIADPARGERVVASGGYEKTSLDAVGTFSARGLGIEPQPVQLRVFVEDYFPDRERVYSPTYVLYVLAPEQHAIWMTEQLSKWHRQSLEVRDREMQLYETNKQLRDLPADQLDRTETRRRIENQAAAERANGRRLSSLVVAGEDLLRQASRNPEFGVGHLERWAEMLQILKDISASRMPSVADLLEEASEAESLAATNPADEAPRAGHVRASGSASQTSQPPDDASKPSAVPQVVDVESTQQPPDSRTGQPPPGQPAAQPSLGLPETALIGGAKEDASCPAGQKMNQAVARQQDLLAEFEKIANELNNILANLEGSTLVKRLKAASREQYRIAGRIGDRLDDTFGRRTAQIDEAQRDVFRELADLEAQSSRNASLIMDDMQAYFERRRFIRFKTVLDDMKDQDVIGGLRQIGEDMFDEHGLSIAQCEYWSDAMDRWAEDLVDPAGGGT